MKVLSVARIISHKALENIGMSEVKINGHVIAHDSPFFFVAERLGLK
jgi:hypothetical protein